MGDTTTQYVPRDFRRVCDQCGNLYQRSRLHRKGPWIYCDSCDEPGDRIREELDRAIARTRPFRILPVPNAKPLDPNNPYNWQAEEAQVFNLVTMYAPARRMGGSSDPAAAAWAGIYLGDIISENTRPTSWVTTSKVTLRACLTYLLTRQYGGGTLGTSTVSNPRYGGISDGADWSTPYTIAAGLAFLRGYAVFGSWTYLAAAERCATFLRHVQSGNLQTTKYTVFPQGGSAYRIGSFATGVVESTGLLTNAYSIADIMGIWFLTELGEVVGTSTSFGDTTSTSFFSAATAGTIAAMISEVQTFAADGVYDATNSSALTPGLSTTAPKTTYVAARNGDADVGSWTASASIRGEYIASALRGLWEADNDSTLVTTMTAWLDAFTANTANATPSTYTTEQAITSITGTYDPEVCIAYNLKTSATFTESTGTYYDLGAQGILAPVIADEDAQQLRDSRSELSPGERFSTFYLELMYLGTTGVAGLSLQPMRPSQGITPDVLQASKFGGIYRVVNP